MCLYIYTQQSPQSLGGAVQGPRRVPDTQDSTESMRACARGTSQQAQKEDIPTAGVTPLGLCGYHQMQ